MSENDQTRETASAGNSAAMSVSERLGGHTDEGVLMALVGGFGSGKTLRAMEFVYRDYCDGYRYLVTNVALNLEAVKALMPELDVHEVANSEIACYWLHHPRNAIVVLDECATVWEPYAWQKVLKANDGFRDTQQQIRKANDRIYLIAQNWNDIINIVRKKVNWVENCYRAKLPFLLFFIRTHWRYDNDKPTHKWAWPRIVPFAGVAKYAKLYDTKAAVGKGADRPAAPMAEPMGRSLPRPRLWWFIVGGVVFLILGGKLGWWKPPQGKTPPRSPAPAIAENQNPNRSATRGPVAKFNVERRRYETSMGTVLALEDERVVVGLDDGRLHYAERDWAAEYSVIRSQAAAQRNAQPGGAAGEAGGAFDRNEHNRRPNVVGIRPW